jgi:hypothetical protein
MQNPAAVQPDFLLAQFVRKPPRDRLLHKNELSDYVAPYRNRGTFWWVQFRRRQCTARSRDVGVRSVLRLSTFLFIAHSQKKQMVGT